MTDDLGALGYTLPSEATATAFYEEFAWALPERYNVAAATLDARAPADRTALRHVDASGERHAFTYSALREAVDAVAAGLAEAGVGRGDRVAVRLPTCPELLAVHLGALRLGAVVVPLSVLLGDEAVSDALDRTAPTVYVADAEYRADADASAAEAVLEVTPGRYADRGPVGDLGSLARADAAVEAAATAPDDPAMVLFTSGTSGAPKGALVPHSYLAGSLPGYHCWFHLFSLDDAADARVWTPAEWAWAGALFDVVYPTLALGGTVVSRCRRSGFDPEVGLSLLREADVSHAFLPPTAVAQLRSAGVDAAPRALDVVMCGGESLAPDLRRWAEDALDAVVNEAYGQTEANATVGNCAAAFEANPGSIGKAYPGHEVAVVDDDGCAVPAGERGELVVELPDPVAFLRYWDDPEATARTVRDGRLHTGDLARRRADGHLVHAGRADELVVTAGYRVDPLEVERTLADHPAVVEAVVGGVPDDERGERVKAAVLPVADATPSDELAADLRDFVRDRIGAHKAPREVSFVSDLPATRTGKADREDLL
ncbi:MAG: AMP-binding protein [Halobacteriaceae archaeon]